MIKILYFVSLFNFMIDLNETMNIYLYYLNEQIIIFIVPTTTTVINYAYFYCYQ